MAVQRRHEGWALTAGLGINLAASLIVGHFQTTGPGATWLGHLIQANGVASAAAALVWLGMRRHIYGQLELSIESGPLIAVQVALGLFANVLLLRGGRVIGTTRATTQPPGGGGFNSFPAAPGSTASVAQGDRDRRTT